MVLIYVFLALLPLTAHKWIYHSKILTITDAMLERMFGTSGDGIHDRLLHFVTPMDGAYYFAPSEELLEEVLER